MASLRAYRHPSPHATTTSLPDSHQPYFGPGGSRGSRIDIRQHKDSSIGYVIRSEPEGLHDRVYDGLEIQKYNNVAISVGAPPLITCSSHILITNLKFHFQKH
jgi:hypothetical protein